MQGAQTEEGKGGEGRGCHLEPLQQLLMVAECTACIPAAQPMHSVLSTLHCTRQETCRLPWMHSSLFHPPAIPAYAMCETAGALKLSARPPPCSGAG